MADKPLDQLGKTYLASETYITWGDKVLMFKRSETSKKFPGFWIGPGGHIDWNEDALTAAIREAEEETGVKVDKEHTKLKAIAMHHHLDLKEVWISLIFLVKIPKGQTVSKKNEEGVAKWIKLSDIFEMENVFPPSRYYFEHVLNDKPGILYTNIDWKNSKLHKVHSHKVDEDH